MRLALVHARAETLQLARYPAFWLPTVGFPAIVLLFFGRQLERGEPDRLLAGFAATALLTVSLFQFGAGIAVTRATPWEAFLRTLPVPVATRLVARILSALVFASATLIVVTVVAVGVYGASPPAWRFALLFLALLVGCIPFVLLGIAFGYWFSPRSALPLANLIFFPLAIGGALWTRPSGDVPRSIDLGSQSLPTRSWMEILDSIATGDSPLPWHHIAALAAWGLVFFALAWWGYRRDEGERFR